MATYVKGEPVTIDGDNGPFMLTNVYDCGVAGLCITPSFLQFEHVKDFSERVKLAESLDANKNEGMWRVTHRLSGYSVVTNKHFKFRAACIRARNLSGLMNWEMSSNDLKSAVKLLPYDSRKLLVG